MSDAKEEVKVEEEVEAVSKQLTNEEIMAFEKKQKARRLGDTTDIEKEGIARLAAEKKLEAKRVAEEQLKAKTLSPKLPEKK